MALVLHEPGSYEPDLPFDAVRTISRRQSQELLCLLSVTKSVECLGQLHIDFPVVVFSDIAKHVAGDETQLVELARSHMVINFLIEFQVLEPERCMLQVVLQTLLTNIDCMFKLIFSFLKPRSIEEYRSIVLALNHQILELLPGFFSVAQSAFTKGTLEQYPPDLFNLTITGFLN